ncbi:hypothetical protein HDV04_005201 [Boothiomyces sp. JEL0838]|nr:hypothetical protein HDV04_005201 [Boothiomyces sp. JEL0838]
MPRKPAATLNHDSEDQDTKLPEKTQSELDDLVEDRIIGKIKDLVAQKKIKNVISDKQKNHIQNLAEKRKGMKAKFIKEQDEAVVEEVPKKKKKQVIVIEESESSEPEVIIRKVVKKKKATQSKQRSPEPEPKPKRTIKKKEPVVKEEPIKQVEPEFHSNIFSSNRRVISNMNYKTHKNYSKLF